MKIIQVISSLGNGGAEKLVVELSNELTDNNDVIIISIKKIEDWMFHAKKIDKSVRIIQLNKKKGFDLIVLYKLLRILRIEKPGAVHIHLSMTLYYFLLIIPFFRKIRFYHTIHNNFELHRKFYSKLNLLPFYRRVINICLSKSIFEKFSLAFPKLKFSMIENGIKEMNISTSEANVRKEIEFLRADKTSKVFLFVGRLTYQKNIPLLLNVFNDKTVNDSKLIIIGTGSDDAIEQVNVENKITNGRIVFLGSKENVIDYLHNVDALVLTSRYEGLPIVILEALSAGIPVLSTPVGGILDIITDGVNGFLTASSQKQDIVDVIDKFCKLDNNEIKRIREANVKLYDEKFSIKICAEKHIVLYKNGML
jgi:glycosyltransferase involved in cell wall biosynthesis